VDWDATRYSDKLPKQPGKPGTKASLEREASQKSEYPPLNGVEASRPCIVVDMQGIVLAWYLPGILNDSRQVGLFTLANHGSKPDGYYQSEILTATEKLYPLLRKKAPKCSTSWRVDPKNFRPGTEAPEGSVSISPAWFQQAHEVSVSAYLIHRQLISNAKRVHKFPQVGSAFKLPATSEWSTSMSESNSILSAMLAVIHPHLYESARETFNRLRKVAEIQPQHVLGQWTSVYSGISIISNRITPPHRDSKSRFPWYDLLVTLGKYRNCNLELPGLGISLEYGPGTVVGLSGMMLEHAVPSFEGDRVCYAYFMRNKVHERMKVAGHVYMNVEYYE
jgi:hypothetical protein